MVVKSPIDFGRKKRLNTEVSYMDNVEDFCEMLPFFYDKTGLFWLWDDKEKKFGLVDEVDMMLLLDDLLGLEGQTVSGSIKNNYLEAFKRVGRRHIPRDAPKKWIQFKDKAFSLKSGKIYDVKPNYFFTNPIPWEMGKSDKTPVMDKLITEWVGEKYLDTAYEIIAYCCLNDYPIHMIFCLVGSGRNGKSKFLGLIRRFIGKDNIVSTELDVLLGSRFESAKLYKKLIGIMGETNFGIISKTSMLKKLTGQDLIGYEFKNKNPFDGENYAKIMIASNSLPTSTDTSEGFYRRWMILDFPNTFPEGKDILKTIPKGEYNNLSLKITKILPKLLEEGKFTHQGSIEERKSKYILSSNPIPIFIKKCCLRADYEFIGYSELYTAYIHYLKVNKKRRVKMKEFKTALEDEGLWAEKTTKKMGDEFKVGYWVEGICLKDSWKDECKNYNNYNNYNQHLNQTHTRMYMSENSSIKGTKSINNLEVVEEKVE